MSSRIYNIISALSLLGTLGVIIGMIVIITTTVPAPPSSLELTQLAESIISTPTPTFTFTPTNTFTATFTPLPPTFTLTPTITNTPLPTITPTPTTAPSATITDTPAPTLTASQTFTPAATNTATPTLTPTGPTPTFTPSVSPYLFGLRDQVLFVRNFANSAGCAWQGIGGQLVGIDGQPFLGNLVVHVYNNNFERRVAVGSNSFYGTTGTNGLNSGWEVPIGNAIDSQLYFVELESQAGTKVSDAIQVQFTNNCEANAGIVNFIQLRPL